MSRPPRPRLRASTVGLSLVLALAHLAPNRAWAEPPAGQVPGAPSAPEPAPSASAAPAPAPGEPEEDPADAAGDAALVAEQPALGAGAGAPGTPPPPARLRARAAPEGTWTRGRQVGVALGVFGVLAAGLGGGLYVGAAASEAERERALSGAGGSGGVCAGGDPVACDRAADAGADASRSRALAAVFLVTGGALVAGGVTLFLLSPPERGGVALAPGPRGVALHGTF